MAKTKELKPKLVEATSTLQVYELDLRKVKMYRKSFKLKSQYETVRFILKEFGKLYDLDGRKLNPD